MPRVAAAGVLFALTAGVGSAAFIGRVVPPAEARTPSERLTGRFEVRPMESTGHPAGDWGAVRIIENGEGESSAVAACRLAGHKVDQALYFNTAVRSSNAHVWITDLNCSAGQLFNNCPMVVHKNATLNYAEMGVDCSGVVPDFPKNIRLNVTLSISPGTTKADVVARLQRVMTSVTYGVPDRIRDVDAELPTPPGTLGSVSWEFDPNFGRYRRQLEFLLFSKRTWLLKRLNATGLTTNLTEAVRAAMEMRIVNLTSTNASRGIVQIRPLPGLPWGTVDDSYDRDTVAKAACRSLGFDGAVARRTNRAVFEDPSGRVSVGDGPRYISFIVCPSGAQTQLRDCMFHTELPFNRYWFHSSHVYDLAVECVALNPFHFRVQRLAGDELGVGMLMARPHQEPGVPVGKWGTVCNAARGVDADVAVAACHSAGFPTVKTARAFVYAADSLKDDPPMAVSRVKCPAGVANGSLPGADLRMCDVYEAGAVQCFEFVGLDCRGYEWRDAMVSPSGDVAGGHHGAVMGTLLVRNGPLDPWGTVCGDYANDANAQVACRTAGFTAVGGSQLLPSFGAVPALPGALANLYCAPGDRFLSNCSARVASGSAPLSKCRGSNALGVWCKSSEPGDAKPVMFVADFVGTSPDSIIETIAYATYSTVDCVRLTAAPKFVTGNATRLAFVFTEAAKRPRILLERRFLYVVGSDSFSRFYGLVMDRLTTNVSAAFRPTMKFRLTDGAGPHEGLLQVKMDDAITGWWGTVCDNGFDEAAAVAACRSMGFATGSAHVSKASPNLTMAGPVNVQMTKCNATKVNTGQDYQEACDFVFDDQLDRIVKNCFPRADHRVSLRCSRSRQPVAPSRAGGATAGSPAVVAGVVGGVVAALLVTAGLAGWYLRRRESRGAFNYPDLQDREYALPMDEKGAQISIPYDSLEAEEKVQK